MRRTGYTHSGRRVLFNFTPGGLLTSYRAEDSPLIRRKDFTTGAEFLDAALRIVSPLPRPRGLPRV